MSPHDPSTEITEDTELPRWVQVPTGLLLGAFTLLCLIGSATLVFSPNEKAPILAPALGAVLVMGCVWVLEKCLRLITGRKRHGGLMSPTALRLVAWFFLFLPIGGLFTGYFKTHTWVALAQTAAYISIFFGLRTLASSREKSVA